MCVFYLCCVFVGSVKMKNYRGCYSLLLESIDFANFIDFKVKLAYLCKKIYLLCVCLYLLTQSNIDIF